MRDLLKLAVLGLAGIALLATPATAEMNWTGSAYLGYAKIAEDGAPDGSIGGRVNALAMVHEAIGVGAEVGYHRFGSSTFAFADTDPSNPGGTVEGETSLSAFQATANVMARGVRGVVRPYAMGGLGVYAVRAATDQQQFDSGGTPVPGSTFDASDTESKFGFNLGGGAQFMPNPESRVSFGVEGRWHSIMDATVDENGDEAALDAFTIMAGINYN